MAADLYDEWALICSALKQMKDGKPAVNSFDAMEPRMPWSSISVSRQDVALRNARECPLPTKVQRESA
jgi:hypothetical protein